jgi:crossover junction endodeoxyribonuclease RusA
VSRTFSLPWPPSVNNYWKPRPRGKGLYICPAGVLFREETCVLLAGSTPLQGRLAVHIEAMPPDRRKRDLDNLLKPTLDAMEHARVFEDDSQIDQLRIDRLEPSGEGRLDVTVTELEET